MLRAGDRSQRARAALVGLAVVTLAVMLGSLFVGATRIDVIGAALSRLGTGTHALLRDQVVLFDIRLPRMLMASGIGTCADGIIHLAGATYAVGEY